MEKIFIPLGEECYTCQSIDVKFTNKEIRKYGFPFDYVGHVYVEKIYDNLVDLFNNKNNTINLSELTSNKEILSETNENTMNLSECNVDKELFSVANAKENIILNINDFEKQKFSEKYYMVNKKYGFKYWHDISSESTIFDEKDLILFIEKYNRRYNRLYDVIKKNQTIIFISVNHFDNIYNKIFKKNEIIKLYNFLESLNNNIYFIAINYENTMNLSEKSVDKELFSGANAKENIFEENQKNIIKLSEQDIKKELLSDMTVNNNLENLNNFELPLTSVSKNNVFSEINTLEENKTLTNKLFFINLDVNRNLPFIESKELFSKNLYSYMKNINI
jgi:hypothetical protein